MEFGTHEKTIYWTNFAYKKWYAVICLHFESFHHIPLTWWKSYWSINSTRETKVTYSSLNSTNCRQWGKAIILCSTATVLKPFLLTFQMAKLEKISICKCESFCHNLFNIGWARVQPYHMINCNKPTDKNISTEDGKQIKFASRCHFSFQLLR